MIKGFASKETVKLFAREFSRKLPQSIQRLARVKLDILDAAEALDDLRVPLSNRLEKLSGDRRGQYSTPALAPRASAGASVRINDRWRICFEWRSGDAYRVEIVDYH